MNEQTLTDNRALEALLDLGPPKERHIFLVAGGRRPGRGDRAYCGYVKRNPTIFATEAESRSSGLPLCAICVSRSTR